MENNIGSRFKIVRKMNNLNQNQFAEAINISQGRLSEIEKGICKPSADTLILIAEQFRVDLNWLLLEDKVELKPLSVFESEFLKVLSELSIELQNETLAQLGEHYTGSVEVSGSIPLCSTIHKP